MCESESRASVAMRCSQSGPRVSREAGGAPVTRAAPGARRSCGGTRSLTRYMCLFSESSAETKLFGLSHTVNTQMAVSAKPGSNSFENSWTAGQSYIFQKSTPIICLWNKLFFSVMIYELTFVWNLSNVFAIYILKCSMVIQWLC